MTYEILYKKEAAKYLAGLDRPTRDRIRSAINELAYTPPSGDIVPMEGMADHYRLRIGPYRIIFKVNHTEQFIYVRTIAPRGDAYKRR